MSLNQIVILTKLGESAFGKNWKATLADDLSIARPTISDWLSGKKPIPINTWHHIQKILVRRNSELEDSLNYLIENTHLIVISEMIRKGKTVIQGDFGDYLNGFTDEKILLLARAIDYVSEKEFEEAKEEDPDVISLYCPSHSNIIKAIDFHKNIRGLLSKRIDMNSASYCAEEYFKHLPQCNLEYSFENINRMLIDISESALDQYEMSDSIEDKWCFEDEIEEMKKDNLNKLSYLS